MAKKITGYIKLSELFSGDLLRSTIVGIIIGVAGSVALYGFL